MTRAETLAKSMLDYSYGIISFEELIALKNELLEKECEHGDFTKKGSYMLICGYCGAELTRDEDSYAERGDR